ncbi:pyridoxamine 5'-phosphate oxidase family protein [Lacticaseibacillus daqingensis]|uniref:pyridoxamine 5'-phosphate oxidase family protein n=1 Tax=Lacticaseibacillus daqingensis TaxID=2486014 RepID=UPI000F77984A|nr:pyridoxamine 5'-phosphate oxidase family protein [Lacticaseibacillus daqingensis]
MSVEETYNQLMTTAEMIALATETTAGHTPSVRFVFFLHATDQPNKIYFGTAGTAEKVAELTANPTVSFETAPVNFQTVRVTGAHVTRVSDRSAFFAAMDAKYPSFSRFTPEYRAGMAVYAATFDEAQVGEDTLSF